jgi:hypothetical protein
MKNITPVKNYKAPNIPTLQTARENPELLKKVPQRWRKKAAVMACMGVAGLVALSSCGREQTHRGGAPPMPIYVTQPTEEELRREIECVIEAEAERAAYENALAQLETAELELRMHIGGFNGQPFYVAYLTEPEAIGFIRARLEAAGINFSTELIGAENIANELLFDILWHFGDDVLFDEERGVVIVPMAGGIWSQGVVDTVVEFSENINAVLFNQGEIIGVGLRDSEPELLQVFEANNRQADEVRQILVERITVSVQETIERLQREGVL